MIPPLHAVLRLGPMLVLGACSTSRAELEPSAGASDVPTAAETSAQTGEAIPVPPAGTEKTITISAVGDCTLGSELRSRFAPGSFHAEMAARGGDVRYPFSGVAHVLAEDDLTIANLETTLTTREPKGERAGYVFRGDPAWARMLVEGSVEIVSVANNHSHDLGRGGFDDTLKALAAQRIGAFGFGLVDRRTIKGVEVVNLGFTGGDPGLVQAEVGRAVAREKRGENVVIVSFHWGGEGSTEPNDDQRRLGRAAIDAGGDLVLGHHPHVIQGIETYRGREIVYSLGNFVFGGHSNPKDKDAIIYQATFAVRDGRAAPAGSRALPVRVSSVTERNDYRPVLMEGPEKERVLARLRAASEAIAEDAGGR